MLLPLAILASFRRVGLGKEEQGQADCVSSAYAKGSDAFPICEHSSVGVTLVSDFQGQHPPSQRDGLSVSKTGLQVPGETQVAMAQLSFQG